MPSSQEVNLLDAEEGKDNEAWPLERAFRAALGLAASVLLVLVLVAARATGGPRGGTQLLPLGGQGFANLLELEELKVSQCPGSMAVEGIGEVHLVNNKRDPSGTPSGNVQVWGGAVHPLMGGRTYFAEKCTDGWYNNNDYRAVSLLEKTIQYTVDMGHAGCGCNVAFYLTSMRQNNKPTACQDFYCDANSVCGELCSEIDIMEANSKVWRSTLHVAADKQGGAAGFGGTGPHTQTWTSKEYGPGAKCIDTNKPFEVLAHFPVHNSPAVLQGMMVELQQAGSPCGLTATVGWYQFNGKDGLVELSRALEAGMVPIVSYWKSPGLTWLDGTDIDGECPCPKDLPSDCPLVGPNLRDFKVRPFSGYIHHSTYHLNPGPEQRLPGAESTFKPVTRPQEMTPALAAAGWRRIENAGLVYYYNAFMNTSAWTLPISV